MLDLIIYKATNKINNKIYIGLTTKSLNKRIKGHLSKEQFGLKIPICNAIRKYGKENFDWGVVATCDTKDKLYFLERFYIKFFNSKSPNGYNLTDGGEDNPMNYEEFRKKVGDLKKGKTKDNDFGRKITSEKLTGKLKTKEHCKNLSISHAGKLSGMNNPNYGKKHPGLNKGKSKSTKGKTYEEIYGVEKGQEMRKIRRRDKSI